MMEVPEKPVHSHLHPCTQRRTPEISVIMPAFNVEKTISYSIESVLAQTFQAFELIVVDDGSTDGTVEIAKRYEAQTEGRVYLLHQNHKGPYPARNHALKYSRGQFVAFLDADDTWSPDCLKKLFTALTANHADIAYCGWQNVGPAAPGTEPYIPPAYEDGDLIAAVLRTCPWPIHAALTRRSAIEAVGGFSERMFTSMDYDFWIRLIAYSGQIKRVPAVLAFYHWHGAQISSDRSRQILDAIQVRRDFVHQNRDRVAHISQTQIDNLIDGYLAKRAYEAFWKRETRTAQKLFRAYFASGNWGVRDLPHILISLLPPRAFDWIISRKNA